MMQHELTLHGCRTRPLSGYLKAVGVLRLISEQGKAPDAKGYWRKDAFVVRTRINREELETFFCKEYSPTPIVAPWNGGSGFYPGDAIEGIRFIEESTDVRFTPYREVIRLIKSWPEMPRNLETVGDITLGLTSMINDIRPGKKRTEVEKLLEDVVNSTPSPEHLDGKSPSEWLLSDLEAQANKKDLLRRWRNAVRKGRTECTKAERGGNKEVILALCRSRLPEVTLQWIDALCAIHPDRKPSYGPILGTGGNEGRLDFSNNFMQQVAGLLLRDNPDLTRSLLSATLFGTVLPGLRPGKIGQYDAGRAGGFNQGMEVETKDFKINPWDYVLMLEGTLLFSSALVRRNQSGEQAHITSPFTVDFSPVGFTSSEYSEAGRQEMWLPLWEKPASCAELKYILGEGRCILGRRQARTGMDFSRGIGSLGVDRGIQAFERYAFLERRGKSYVALPAGKHTVRHRKNLEYLFELDLVTTPLDRFLREFKSPPASFMSARRRIDEALFACTNDPTPYAFAEFVACLGRMEKLLAVRDRKNKPSLQKPLLGLSPQWIALCDSGTPEVRVAGAIASIQASGKVGPIRTNLAGVDPQFAWKWGGENTQHVWLGNSSPERLGRVFCRRMLDAERFLLPTAPFEALLGLCPQDVMPFLRGETDANRIEDLLWGFTLIDWRKPGSKQVAWMWRKPIEAHPVSRAYALLKLVHSPTSIQGKVLRKETRIAHLLGAGRIGEACEVAAYRLRVSELKPFDVAFEEELDPERLLSSLLIPITDQGELESLVLQSET